MTNKDVSKHIKQPREGKDKQNIKKIVKALSIILVSISISFIIIGTYQFIKWSEFQKVYNSYEEKKLSLKIEKNIETYANKIKETNQNLSINFIELTNGKHVDQICIAGPYNPDINKTLGINWEQSKIWDKQIVCNDTLRSIFLIHDNKVIPIKLRINIINRIYIDNSCINVTDKTKFILLKDDSKVYLKITN